MKKPELLLPVGDMEMCLAAIHYGANAIYVGVPGFNARGRTKDHNLSELKEMIQTCHLYGVKVYLAFNVLIFENELDMARELLYELIPLGIDAFIVQDLGLVKLIREIAPEQVIHGSTQMTVTNAEAIEFLNDLNIKRFVLGRENSLIEIKSIKEKTDKELEVFVHGALCVAYSGQCFTSESLGGRSANRGQCAQSCRLSYDLIVDGEKKDLGEKKYLVSPQDLCGIDHVNELMEIGVDSLKIEGRLKGAEYVASTAFHYQNALNGNTDSWAKMDMASIYSRGFFPGWYNGVNHQELVTAYSSSHIGHEIGFVSEVKKNLIKIKTEISLKAGMGICFVQNGEVKGAKIYKVLNQANSEITLELFQFDYSKIKTNEKIYLNSDETKKDQWAKREKKIPLRLYFQIEMDKKLKLRAIDPDQNEVIIQSELLLQESTKLSGQKIIEDEFKVLGGSAFLVNEFNWNGSTDFFLPKSEIKRIKRILIEKMTLVRIRPNPIEIKTTVAKNPIIDAKTSKIKLNILLRSIEQVHAFIGMNLNFEDRENVGFIFLDFEFGKNDEEATKLLKENNFKVFIATTRILKPNEYYNLNRMLRADPDGFLVRNLGALQYLKTRSQKLLWGDFSLNVSNSKTADYLLNKGLLGINLSYDLNAEQLKSLIGHVNPSKLEVTVYQYMPEFHMEHCVFAGFLSTGKSFKDCGKPCEKHEVGMRDSYGNYHHLKADQECRNTLYRGSSQSALSLIDILKKAEINSIRFEALNEKPQELQKRVRALLDLMGEKVSSLQAVKDLSSTEKYGVSTGQIFKADQYQNKKQRSSLF